jgi:hypothetical protein
MVEKLPEAQEPISKKNQTNPKTSHYDLFFF